MKILTTSDSVRAHLESNPKTLLIHVLPSDVFTARRIPGSKNACVFEVSFLSQIEAVASHKNAPLILYGAGAGSHDATVAAEKLAAAGYSNLTVFEGGLEAWTAEGGDLEGESPLPAPPVLDGAFEVDTAASVVRWTGRNPLNHHHGTVKVASGLMQLRDGRIISGRFALDMNSILCEDIPDPAVNAMLIRHLRDADFFLVDRYPTAKFVLRKAEPIAGSTEGTPNWQVHGDFTLRGVTRPLTFPMLLAAASSERLTAQAQFEVNRTDYGSIYGSGRFFRYLGKHVVNDHVYLHVKLHADKTGRAAG